jgi:predicted NBD/HSP70 family sugar kinase
MMVGVDIRDGDVLAVAVDADGKVASRAAIDTKKDAATNDAGAAAIAAVERVTPAAGGASSLGIASSVLEATVATRVLDSLASRYAALFQLRAVVGPGTASAVAESWIGAARGVADVVYFGVAEHATAGIVSGGRAVTGAHGREPMVGWLALNPVEREDYRKAGCLEAEVAAMGIVRRLVWRIKAGDRSRVQDKVNGELSAITAALVLDAAREKDGVSISVMRDTAKYLGMAAANLVVMADPATLVLGGLMASARDLLLEPILWELGRKLPGPMMEALKIVTAALGDDAAAIGAARYAATAQTAAIRT